MDFKKTIKDINRVLKDVTRGVITPEDAWYSISGLVLNELTISENKLECNCLIKHAITREEQALIFKEFGNAKVIGDTIGAMLCLEQLRECPTKNVR